MKVFDINVRESVRVTVYELSLDGFEVGFDASIDYDNDISIEVSESEIKNFITTRYTLDEIREFFGE